MKILKTFLILVLLVSCNKNKTELEPVTVQIHFSHHWDNVSITKSDFNSTEKTPKSRLSENEIITLI